MSGPGLSEEARTHAERNDGFEELTMSMVTDYAAMTLHRERAGRLLAEAEAGRLSRLARAARKRNARARTRGTGTTENNGSSWVRAA